MRSAFRLFLALVLSCLAVPLGAQSTVPPNLLSQWHFDEGTGTSTADSAGASTGTLTGTVAWVPGLWSNAVRPDGLTGYVSFGTQAALNIAASAPFSVSGWFNVPATEVAGPIFTMRSSTLDGPIVDICIGHDGGATDDGKLMALVRDDTNGAFARVQSAATVNNGAWHHFALTRNAAGQIELFLDATSQGTSTGAASGGAITTDLRAMGAELRWISTATMTADQQFLNGTIEEVQFYGRQLVLADVQTLAAPPAPTGVTATPGDGTVALSWNASPTATGYTVRRGTSAIGPFTPIAGSPTSGTTLTDTGATNGTTWHYVINATNGSLTSADSAVVSATPQAPIVVPPPSGGGGGSGNDGRCGCSTVSLSWTGVIPLLMLLALVFLPSRR